MLSPLVLMVVLMVLDHVTILLNVILLLGVKKLAYIQGQNDVSLLNGTVQLVH